MKKNLKAKKSGKYRRVLAFLNDPGVRIKNLVRYHGRVARGLKIIERETKKSSDKEKELVADVISSLLP